MEGPIPALMAASTEVTVPAVLSSRLPNRSTRAIPGAAEAERTKTWPAIAGPGAIARQIAVESSPPLSWT